MTSVWGIVVAGGSGSRFGQPKQFALLAGRPLVEWSVTACRSAATHGVVLVLPAGAPKRSPGGPPRYGADVVVAGGSTRSDSVRRGLHAVPADAEVVVVHDAARPLAPAGLFAAVVAALADGTAAGAVCAVPVADTLKEVDRPLVGGLGGTGGPTVTGTLDRERLVAVQTPQAFVAAALRRAHAGGGVATDDAALVEALGLGVRVVPGDPANLKVTTPADLAYAQHLVGA